MEICFNKKFNLDHIRKTNFCIKNSNTKVFKMTKSVNISQIINICKKFFKTPVRINAPI